MTKRELLLDAKTLGMMMRNIAAIEFDNAVMLAQINRSLNKILFRYNCNNVAACEKEISRRLKGT